MCETNANQRNDRNGSAVAAGARQQRQNAGAKSGGMRAATIVKVRA